MNKPRRWEFRHIARYYGYTCVQSVRNLFKRDPDAPKPVKNIPPYLFDKQAVRAYFKRVKPKKVHK